MSQWSGIARIVEKAPWKTPDQLRATRETKSVHDPVHGQTLPVFIGSAAVEGITFWRDGPRIVTSTVTEPTKVPKNNWSSFASGTGSETLESGDTLTRIFVSFAVAHSFNQFQRPSQLLKVEFDDVVVFDVTGGWQVLNQAGIWVIVNEDDPPPSDGTRTQRSRTNEVPVVVYDGIDNEINPTMLARDGAETTPAYHGLRYLFFEDVDLTMYDGAIPASIRIWWGDAEGESSGSGVIPLLATEAEGYSQYSVSGTKLAYDPVSHRFANMYVNDDVHYIGVTDFGTKQEVSLAQITGSPVASDAVLNPCWIPGTGLMLGQVNVGSDWTDVLIDAASGVIVDSTSNATERVVEWRGALPFIGASDSVFIAVGRMAHFSHGRDMPVAFMQVNATEQTIEYLEFGSDGLGNGTAAFSTPGFANETGTSFYTHQNKTIYEALFTSLAAPTWREVYTFPEATTIQGSYYDASLNTVTINASIIGAYRSINATSGDVVWGAPGSSTVWRVHPGGGSYNSLGDGSSSAVTARLQPGYAILVRQSISTGAVIATAIMDLSDGSIEEMPLIDDDPADHIDQSSCLTAYALFTDEWRYVRTCSGVVAGIATLDDELTTFSIYDDNRGGLLTDVQVTTEGLDGITNGGVIIDTDTDLRELASRLAELYGVLKVETATGVKWVLKGKDGEYTPDVVLTEADLVEERQGDAVVKIATRHRNPKEIPAEVEVRYISSDDDYQPAPARAAWPQGVFDTALSLLKRSLSVPVVLTVQQALELAWGMLARERAADRKHSITLRPNRLGIEPADVFEITAGGQTIVGQFTKQTKRPDHALEMEAEGYLSRAATPVAAESPIVHVLPTPDFDTTHVFLDGPLVLASHDGGGLYLNGYSVVTGLEGWIGGAVHRRRAGETAWTKVGEYAGAQPVVGVLTAPLAASPWPFETDTENEITFDVIYGDADEITSQDDDEFYAAASLIAVGAPGRWNFLTWRNKTVNEDGSITLDTLRQGLRGTEVFEGTSEAEDYVVLVKPSQAMRIPYDLADLGQSVEFKATGWGVHPTAVEAHSFTVSAGADTPRAPGNLAAVIDGSDIDMTWDRRSRLLVDSTGDFGDDDEAPLGADLDVYLVEILDGPGGTVVRTYADVAGEAKTYPSADITSDFGSMPDALTFRVRQKTSLTGIGHGYAAERSVSLS